MTHGMETFYKNDKLFYNRLKVLDYNRLKVLENSTAVLAKAAFNDLQALTMRKNGHNEDQDFSQQ